MIELDHVSRNFGDFRAVDDVSLSIQTGEIVGLLGPNGAGKTTTMRMITGFLEPSSGSIKIDGLDETVSERIVKQSLLWYAGFCILEVEGNKFMLSYSPPKEAISSSELLNITILCFDKSQLSGNKPVI